ncbi:hypothetical protein RFI_05166 [Reticulomyxa filosa]|uniref:Uncharacterized protein n=1 Tax=Reticulomyxa filosa TaxID=46433 RepID=X6P156_RETFI|nr:hypothetical protein RFI_05166 [Reticulomyxa filosa]|eukprot:ETO31951.1 hypothetical protein RFI_05166 [Reticulomyxa filosa]
MYNGLNEKQIIYQALQMQMKQINKEMMDIIHLFNLNEWNVKIKDEDIKDILIGSTTTSMIYLWPFFKTTNEWIH